MKLHDFFHQHFDSHTLRCFDSLNDTCIDRIDVYGFVSAVQYSMFWCSGQSS